MYISQINYIQENAFAESIVMTTFLFGLATSNTISGMSKILKAVTLCRYDLGLGSGIAIA